MDPRRMCPHCRAFITSSDRVCPYCNETVGPRAAQRLNASSMLGGFIPHARFVTVMILLINFGLYAATALFSMRVMGNTSVFDIDGQTLMLFGAKYLPGLRAGQWWRLVTAGFLHGGIIHILMNSWVLFDLGAQVEEAYGTSRLMVIYLLTTIAGFWASAWWSMALSIGSSAGIFGLIGAMIALGVTHRSAFGDAIKGMYIRWAIYGLLFGLITGYADNAAHVGGLAAGFGIAYFAGLPRYEGSTQERVWKFAGYAALAVTAYSFYAMLTWFMSVRSQAM